MVSAVEIYNKPNIFYREETFAILAINSWELLLKAQLLRINRYNMNILYVKQKRNNKNGTTGKRTEIKRNRCGNPLTISIIETMNKLIQSKHLSENVRSNIESLIELRDNSIHFITSKPIQIELHELSCACILNYIAIIKKWELNINLTRYNFQLLPLAFVDPETSVKAALTSEQYNYINFFLSRINNQETKDESFNVAIKVGVHFEKKKQQAITVTQGKDGIQITLSEEDFKDKYPMTYKDVQDKAKLMYSDIIFNSDFNSLMVEIKKDPKYSHIRKLDPQNPKSPNKYFYSEGVWNSFFDIMYKRKEG